MNSLFNALRIESGIKNMSHEKRIAFGILCCDRLLPNYISFSREVGWGDVSVLHEVINQLKNYIANHNFLNEDLNTLRKKCLINAPDSDDCISLLTGSAQEAVFSICCVLDYIETNDYKRILQVSEYCTDTVDLYVQELEDMCTVMVIT